MPFVSATLENDLKKVFKDMKDAGEDASDDDFADGIAAACKAFGETGMVTTTDVGAVSAGAFTGAGTGTLKLDDSLMASPIKSACSSMKNMTEGGDNVLAAAIGNGLMAMTSAGEVNTNVTGTVIPPNPPTPVPLAGTAKGTITCVPAPVISGLQAAYASMKSMTDGGDDFLASQMATLINAYFAAGIIATQGSGALAGSIGTGVIA